jgi:predicted transcriptional regulator
MSPTLQSPVSRRPSAAGGVRNGRPVAQARAASKAEPRWTFLTNHAHVLIVLSKNPSTVLREVAVRVGITERAVQRIIADLERDGFIEREKVGRQNSYRLRSKQPLRHPIEAHRSIGDLIDLI